LELAADSRKVVAARMMLEAGTFAEANLLAVSERPYIEHVEANNRNRYWTFSELF